MRFWVFGVSIVWFGLAATLSAEPWYILFDQAQRDLSQQRWQEAIVKLQQAIEQNPSSGYVTRGKETEQLAYFPYFLLGKAYYHLGRYDEASQYFKQEAGSHPTGRIATEIGLYLSYLRAIQADRQRVSEFDRFVERAQVLRAKGLFQEASQALKQARHFHASEFERRNLGPLLTELQKAQTRKVKKTAKSTGLDPNTLRQAVISAYVARPESAVRLLENVRARWQGPSAELEISTGIAYARLSFLTLDPLQSESLREKASVHFKAALALDPARQLDSRLVAPQIIELFAAAR
ncbi:MAG TPA: hypothetical protein PLP42_21905 [Acidobacteriota bacterium]|nr:hypothetical protein [Acidobacteriota bacterium]